MHADFSYGNWFTAGKRLSCLLDKHFGKGRVKKPSKVLFAELYSMFLGVGMHTFACGFPYHKVNLRS